MKIAIFTNNYLPRISGVAVAVDFQDRALRNQGHDTLIIAPDYGFEKEKDKPYVKRVKSLKFVNFRFSIPLQFLELDEMEKLVSDFDPDILHLHHPFLLGKAGLELADELQIPSVYTFHTLYDFFTHYFFLDVDAIRKMVRDYVVNFANQCELVIAPTEPIRNYLLEIGVTTNTATVPTGLDFSRFDLVSKKKLQKRIKTLGLQRFDKLLLYVGRIAREKNLSLAIQALHILKQKGFNLALIIAGEGPAKRGFEREAKKLKLTENIIWAGFLSQEELPELYLISDIFVFPSPSDTQGIVLYEARACGLPIVALRSMASEAIVKDGENGIFAENEPLDFANKIQEVLSNPEKFDAPFDRTPYTLQTIGKRYTDLYEPIVKEGRIKKHKNWFPFQIS